jgi:hypothetical protein
VEIARASPDAAEDPPEALTLCRPLLPEDVCGRLAEGGVEGRRVLVALAGIPAEDDEPLALTDEGADVRGLDEDGLAELGFAVLDELGLDVDAGLVCVGRGLAVRVGRALDFEPDRAFADAGGLEVFTGLLPGCSLILWARALSRLTQRARAATMSRILIRIMADPPIYLWEAVQFERSI